MKCTTRVKLVISGTTGSVLAVAGVVLVFVFPIFIKNSIKEKIPITPTSATYTAWKNPPAEIYLQFWVFNVTNPLDVVQGKDPVVKEMGPYTYREHMPKTNITFGDDTKNVSFVQPKTLIFDRELSVGSEEDVFTNINLIYMTIAEFLRFENSSIRWFANEGLKLADEHLYTQYTVKDILWGLKHDNIINLINELAVLFNKTFNINFGLFTNGSTDGIYTINTGVSDVNQFNKIEDWNGKNYIDAWTTPWARMINGTDGTLFPPYRTKSDEIYIFSSDICRSISFTYEKERSVKGIDVLRFIPPPYTFQDIQHNPSNIGYCTPNKDHCLGSGVLNISLCKFGAPVIISQPHFYQGAQKYIDRIAGLNPVKAHETFIDLEPMTGAAFHVAKRLQLNLGVNTVSEFEETKNIKGLLIHPLLWLNESAVLNDKSANDFKNQILLPIQIVQYGQYGLIGLGGLILICTLVIATKVYFKKNKEPDEDSLVVNE